MPERRQYDHPPIIEAIVDIHAEILGEDVLDRLQTFADDYPNAGKPKPLSQSTFTIHSAPGATTVPVRQTNLGSRIEIENGKYVILAKKDGLLFSQLREYTNRDDFFSAAKEAWRRFTAHFNINPITRAGIRFMNRLNIPQNNQDVRHFLRTFPEMSSDLQSENINGFQLRVDMPQPDLGAQAIIRVATIVSNLENVTSILLDVDVFQDGLMLESQEEFWLLARSLKDRESTIFEACITEHTRRLFDADSRTTTG